MPHRPINSIRDHDPANPYEGNHYDAAMRMMGTTETMPVDPQGVGLTATKIDALMRDEREAGRRQGVAEEGERLREQHRHALIRAFEEGVADALALVLNSYQFDVDELENLSTANAVERRSTEFGRDLAQLREGMMGLRQQIADRLEIARRKLGRD